MPKTRDGVEIDGRLARVWFVYTGAADAVPLGIQDMKASCLDDYQIGTAYSTEAAAYEAARRLHGFHVDRVRQRHAEELANIEKRAAWLAKPAALADA